MNRNLKVQTHYYINHRGHEVLDGSSSKIKEEGCISSGVGLRRLKDEGVSCQTGRALA